MTTIAGRQIRNSSNAEGDEVMNEHEKLARARQKVEAMTGFYLHFAAFLAVLAILFALNAATDPEWWVHWVFIGWGLGVIAHACVVFGRMPSFITNWQLRKIIAIKDSL